ncbi:uncharacterized protein LOC116031010 [Ipomoea triloba]|uniref:uncharacterized protein LOC116031010 n=1 Tax=Ipomoea triloba TaxID=35885 RepID=UPI00125D2B5A|nr:uncharacterized protein LOC116031010 [Ipomoea triloba]GLL26014.1 uncharacterized protein LOC109189620 [Ipomoea trifida]GMC80792.1 Transmembrane protein [Ipomoea batatas]GMC83190.1 Transmembrane protein [Ipomoea batatas]GMC85164.1 Transmembrane protein [Ipomoea batatas]GMC87371.1 Transmembrane protein [Ipomoea batatas]
MELCKLLLLLTILAFSLFLSSLATPHASASVEQIGNPKAVLNFVDKASRVDVSSQRGLKLEEDDESVWLLSTRRMGAEEEDYSGTGANTRHDPNPPGNND